MPVFNHIHGTRRLYCASLWHVPSRFLLHRSMGMALRRFLPLTQERVDIVGLLDEWAARFFEELDYVREGNNATRFAEEMRRDLPQACEQTRASAGCS